MKASGAQHMALDLEFFERYESGQTTDTLRIYSWGPPCISLGYSQKIEEEVDAARAADLGWDIVKRPTGGGIVFHNEAEVTYSLITGIDKLPAGLIPSYKRISKAVVAALSMIGIKAELQTSPRHSLRSCHPSPSSMERGMNPPKAEKGVRSLCFSYPAEYEIVADGRKIVGSAQKRGRKALLQQGSIFVRRTPNEVFSVLKRKHDDLDAISVEEILGRVPSFAELSQALIDSFREGLGLEI